MADELSEMFSKIVAHTENSAYMLDLMHRGWTADEALSIVETANKSFDTNPRYYNNIYNNAIWEAIREAIQQKRVTRMMQSGGQVKSIKPQKTRKHKHTISRKYAKRRKTTKQTRTKHTI